MDTAVGVAVVAEPESELAAEVGELGLAAATTNGFDELPPVASCRLKAVVPIMSCCWRLADVSVESIGSPFLTAQIQALLVLVGSKVPALQERQLSQRTLAVMLPSDCTPDPSNKLTVASELKLGWDSLVADRGDKVTLPSPEA